MNPRYLRNIAALLLVWLVSQQAVAFVSDNMKHSPSSCHEQMTTVDCVMEQTGLQHHGSHESVSVAKQTLACDHCATFCQFAVVSPLPLHVPVEGSSSSITESIPFLPSPTISGLYRPPIIA